MKHETFRLLMRLYRYCLARKTFYAFNKLLFNLSLRGIGVLNDEDESWTYTGETHFLRQLASIWQGSPTVLDVGAHCGQFASMVMRLAPQATVYAFEPHPKTFLLLARQAKLYGYTALNVGCGEERAAAALYDYEGQDGSPHASLYQEVIESLHKGKAAAISTGVISLDDFISEQRIPRVELVKIDAEGHELKVLAGLKSSIARQVVDVIQFEFNAMNVISRVFFRDFCTLLPSFRFYRLLPDGPVSLGEYSPISCELFASQNIVAVRRDCGVHF